MTTVGTTVGSDAWVDISTELALTEGIVYSMQNNGHDTLLLAESVLDPGLGFLYGRRVFPGLSYDISYITATALWARATSGMCVISID